MNLLTESYIDACAPNAAASKNGRGLVKSGKFTKLWVSTDESLIFGECKGSGAKPYFPSVDFLTPEQPVYRCTCPSRQFPCKHTLGLMYAWVEKQSFVTADIPEDIQAKRQKAEKRIEKSKAEPTSEKKKSNKSAQLKKIKTQLEGLEQLEKIVERLLQSGLGTVDRQTLQWLKDQGKQMGSRYLTGIQFRLNELQQVLNADWDAELRYEKALELLMQVKALATKGTAYLQIKLERPELEKDATNALEEQLGHAWSLAELKELGLVVQDQELVQLAFVTHEDHARMEYVDTGIWLVLGTGQLVRQITYRPFKAAKFIKAENSVFDVVACKELYTYPGTDINPRVRWEESTIRLVAPTDIQQIRRWAQPSFKEGQKQVKNQWKNVLSDKNPLVLVAYDRVVKVEDSYVLVDQAGTQIPLADGILFGYESMHLLSLLQPELLRGQVMLLRFDYDWKTGRLQAMPLAIVSETEILRFMY